MTIFGIVQSVDVELSQCTIKVWAKMDSDYYKFDLIVITQNQYENCGDYIP